MSNAIVKVQFHGDELDAIQDANGRVLVSLRRCCENLGLDLKNQLVKLKSKAWAVVVENTMTAPDGKAYSMACIDLDTLPGWLFSIDARKVKEEIREKLARYQRECAKVLRDHFFGPATTGSAELDPDPIINKLMKLQLGIDVSIETRRKQVEMERVQADMVRQLWTVHQESMKAQATANAALHQSTSNHGYFTVLGYSRLRNREMPVSEASQHGRKLTAMCQTRGITPGQMTDPRFGEVNTYPETVLREYFGD